MSDGASMRGEVVERLQEIVDIAGVELEEVAALLGSAAAGDEDVASCLRRAIWQLGAALEITEGTRAVWPRDAKRAGEIEDAHRRRREIRAGRVPSLQPAGAVES